MSMHKYFRFMLVLLLPVIAGCSGMGTIGLSQDNPESINRLLEEHEYARARQLTSKHASLDTPELQARISKQEASFEENTYSEARTLESGNDLLGAVRFEHPREEVLLNEPLSTPSLRHCAYSARGPGLPVT